MLRPTRSWALVPPGPIPPGLASTARRLAVSPRLLGVLAARGHTEPEALEAFLSEPLAGLHDPGLLPDAGVFRERLERARNRGERVLVYGDFDADGLTALAVMVLALRGFGLAVEPYAPSRLADGHGLSVPAVERAVAERCSVIVTVDCGTSSAAEIALAASHGIDVLVTDHHHVPEEAPGGAALMNPQRADSRYPDRRLTGAGIALKAAQLLLDDRPGGHRAWLALTDLAAIGTISDVAPLVGENRSIVQLGLEQLRTRPRAGLAALLAAAGIAPARVDAETIAYTIAPRLNAAGRVGEVTLAARLLLADDAAEAADLAAQLESANRTRRDLVAAALVEARAAVGDPGEMPAVVVAGPWPVGLIGLVAGRLAEEHRRPAVVFSTNAEPWRGSARSPVGALDLAQAFAATARHFVRYGGHPEAAGCDMLPDRLEPFREEFLMLAAGAPAVAPEPALRIDLAVPAGEVDYALYRELERLQPCGAGNPAPQLAVLGATVTRVKRVANGHLQLTVSKGREVVDVIAFGRADLADQVAPGDRLDMVAQLASRTYGGFESLQLELIDAASAGTVAALAPVAAPAGMAPYAGRVIGAPTVAPS
ncbi:MAG: single-stranded-DNA-specific exonuclease RecJ [Candidatus Limnocylindrales bacterium]